MEIFDMNHWLGKSETIWNKKIITAYVFISIPLLVSDHQYNFSFLSITYSQFLNLSSCFLPHFQSGFMF